MIHANKSYSLCLADSYWTNPQYRVKIGGQSPENNGEKNVLVSLMQKPDKRNRHLVQSLHIGLCVFEVNTVVPFAFVVKV